MNLLLLRVKKVFIRLYYKTIRADFFFSFETTRSLNSSIDWSDCIEIAVELLTLTVFSGGKMEVAIHLHLKNIL